VALDQPLRRLALRVLAQLLPLAVVLELSADAMRPMVEHHLVDADLDHRAQQVLAASPRQPLDLVALRGHLVEIAEQL
jgi:hypothetical protein